MRAARQAVGVLQTDVARRTPLSQTSLSRMEQDPPGAAPTLEQAAELADLYRLNDRWRAALLTLVTEWHERRLDVRYTVVRGVNVVHTQQRIRRAEQGVSLTRTYSAGLMPGPVQSPTYAAAVFRTNEDDPRVRERLERTVERNPQRRYQLVLSAQVAVVGLRSAAVMVEQFEHLVQVSKLPNVDLGWIPAGTLVEMTPRLTGFAVHDDRRVVISQVDGYAELDDADSIIRYTTEFERLRGHAVAGDEARAAFAKTAEWWRARQ